MQGFHQRKVHGKHRTELKSNKKIYTENIIFEYTENLKKKMSSNIKNRHEKK